MSQNPFWASSMTGEVSFASPRGRRKPPELVSCFRVPHRLTRPNLLIRRTSDSSLPPSLLATIITALHARPLQALPLAVFTPPLLFASYLNLAGWTTGAAGLSAAWSGLYALLALRRRQPAGLRARFSTRGAVRGAAIGLGAANCAAGGWAYFMGDFEKDAERREMRKRWDR